MTGPTDGLSPTLAPTRVIGRYLLGHAIAAGGMATVHVGRLLGPAGFSRTVAIKQLRAQDTASAAMFLDEARLASRIHHPNVVSPLDVVLLGGEAFIVMEYVHGESLSGLMKVAPNTPVRPPIAAAIVGQVLLGLHAAHRATSEEGDLLGLVHRDVSPQNILVSPEGVARLLDFGIAKAVGRSQATASGILKGKLAYMTPEQVTSAPLDGRTDLFAVGTVLWEMLTGERLFLADTPAGCVEKVQHLEIAPPSQLVRSISPELDRVVLTALARDPRVRFADAHAMALELARAVPAATSFEVGNWVRESCGYSLAERAERIAEFEAIPLEELTLELPPMTFGAAARVTAAPRETKGAETGSRSGSLGATALSPAAPRHQRLLLGGIAVLTLATLVLMVTRGAPRAPESMAVPLPGQRTVRAAALEPSLFSDALAREPVRTPIGVEKGASAALPSSTAQTSASVPIVRPSRARVVTSKPRVPALKAAPAPSAKDRGCDILYSVDSHGLKHFKPECF